MLREVKHLLHPLRILYSKLKFNIYRSLAVLIVHDKIDDYAILFISMQGKSYGSNPKAFSDYIIKNFNNKYKLYWVFQKGIDCQTGNNITKLQKNSLNYYIYLLKCKYIFSDQRMTFYDFPDKQKEQIYVQTYHGTPLKRIERDAIDTLGHKYKDLVLNDSQKITYFTAGSEFSADYFSKYFWYDGEIKLIGTPRNDCFFQKNTNIVKNIKHFYNIEEETKIVLFAPTFRNTHDDNSLYRLNFEKIREVIENRFGGRWVIMARLHAAMIKKADILPRKVINATLYPDMQELLYAVDILITDYSSSFFDFSLSHKPCFLYGKDYKQYDRGFTMNIDKLSYPFSRTEEELYNNIRNYNVEKSIARIDAFNKKIGMFEDGHCCERMAKLIGIS